MAAARFLAGLLLAAALQAASARLVPGLTQWIDLFLVVTVVVARRGHPEGALFAGLAAGWTADALSGAPFGLFGFTDAAGGYGAALASRALVVARPGSIASLFALSSAAQSVLVVALAWLGLGGAPPAPLPLLVRVGTTVVLGLLWLQLRASVGSRFARRRGRPSGSIELPKSLLR